MKLFLYVLIFMFLSFGIATFINQYMISERWQKEAISNYNKQVKKFYNWRISDFPKPQSWWFRENWFNTTCAWVQLLDSIISMLGIIIPTSILLYQRRSKNV